MKKIDYEQISSLMDNEDYDLEHTIDNFLQDEESERVWYEYHLIRDCLRHQESKLGFDINPDIKAKIRQEPQYNLHKKKAFNVANMPVKTFASIASVACVLVIASVAWNIKSTTNMDNQAMVVMEESTAVVPTLAGIDVDDLVIEKPAAIEISTTPNYAKYEYVQNQDYSNFNNPYLNAHFEAVTHDGLMRAVAVGE